MPRLEVLRMRGRTRHLLVRSRPAGVPAAAAGSAQRARHGAHRRILAPQATQSLARQATLPDADSDGVFNTACDVRLAAEPAKISVHAHGAQATAAGPAADPGRTPGHVGGAALAAWQPHLTEGVRPCLQKNPRKSAARIRRASARSTRRIPSAAITALQSTAGHLKCRPKSVCAVTLAARVDRRWFGCRRNDWVRS